MEVRLSVLKDSITFEKIEDSVYFGEEYEGYIDNSRLSLLNPEQNGNTAKYLNGFKCASYKTYFDIGHAVHGAILENKDICDYVFKPGGDKLNDVINHALKSIDSTTEESGIIEAIKKSCRDNNYRNGVFSMTMINNIYEKSKDYISHYVKNPDMTYLTKNDFETASACISAIRNDSKIQELLNPSNDDISEYRVMNEYAITLKIEVRINGDSVIIPIKGKLDNLIFSDNEYYINDLKTTMHRACSFDNSVKEFHYYRQAAFYRFLVESMNTGLKFGGFNFVCVSTTDYSTCIRKVSEREMTKGREEFVKLLIDVALIEMAKVGTQDVIHIFDRSAFKVLAVGYEKKIALISLLCFLQQAFDKKGEQITTRGILERVRKDKFSHTSERLVQALSFLVQAFYSPKDTYPTYGCKSAKEISNMINDILDKELPFEDCWDCTNDLPF